MLPHRPRGASWGSAERWEFYRLHPTGDIRQIVRVPWLDRGVSSEEAEMEREAMVRPESSAEYRSLVGRLEVPETRPAYSDLLVAENGWVWAAHYRSLRTEADLPTRWSVFDSSGALIGEAITPSRFTLFEVGSGHVVGVRRDSLDVETVEVLRLTARE